MSLHFFEKRLKKSLIKHFYSLFLWRDEFKIIRKKNIFWLLNRINLVDRQFGMFGKYEDAQIDLLCTLLDKEKPFDCFFDIGANFGLYSLILHNKKLVKHIHAFEPDARNYAQLQANILLNKGFDTIKTHNIGLSQNNGFLIFDMYPEKSTGQTRVAETQNLNKNNRVSVPVQTLDSLFDMKDKALAFKIDVEGHEKAVILGAETLLRNNRCLLQIEIWEEKTTGITEILEQWGYKRKERIENDAFWLNYRETV